MKLLVSIACTLIFATATPAFAQDDGGRSIARTYLHGILPGLRFLPSGFKTASGEYEDKSYEGAEGLHVTTLVSQIETNDPCWLQFNRHFAGYATEDATYPPSDNVSNFDFRNIDYVLTDGLRVFIKNSHWGPYPAILYATDAATAQRLAVSVRKMSETCKGVPE